MITEEEIKQEKIMKLLFIHNLMVQKNLVIGFSLVML